MSVAVVVGATGALGAPIASRLADAGFAVVAVARHREPLEALAADTPGVECCVADVTADAAVDAIRGAIRDRPVTLAVHCAAAPLGGNVLSVAPAAIARAVEVKVSGLLRLVRAVDSGLGKGSRVVAVGGSLGYDPDPHGATAGVANAAQANLVRQLSQALGSRGATSHTVAPGPVDTERFRTLAAEEAVERGVDTEVVLMEARATVPRGRLTTPEEVAWAVRLLADSEAAALSGGTLLLDGGRRTAIP
jgi:NAD(P)-dependent dehydrogenase (short-subunit alcohol dehydrogenase family)